MAVVGERDGDVLWSRLVNHARPRRALSALGDQIEAQLKSEPTRFPEIKDSKETFGSGHGLEAIRILTASSPHDLPAGGRVLPRMFSGSVAPYSHARSDR